MNKYIFIFLFFANQLFASSDSIVVSRCYSMYDGVSTGYSYSVDRYDSAGNFLSNNLIQSTLNNTPYIKQRTTRVVNQFGNPVSSLAETWNGSDWDSTSVHFYVYDNARNLIADTSINYINNSSSLTLYDWDLNNDTLAVKHLYFSSGNYLFGDSTHYLFNVNGLIDTYESYYGVTLDPVSRKSYFYDASNRVISYTTQIDTGSGWENSQQFLYSYDASNRLTGYSYRNWVGAYWDVINTSNYFFTPSGKIDHSMVSQFSGCCPDSILTFNTYDASDSLTQIDCFKFWFPSNTSDSSRTVYLRDANGYVTDSYEMKVVNGVYHNSGLYHHDLSLLPDTDRVYYMLCDSVACTDTLEFIIYSYFPGGQTYYIHHYTGGGQFVGGEILTTIYDGQGRLIYSEGRTWGPGNLGHGIQQWGYDTNGNLIFYYTLGSGSLDIPTETTCYYEFYSGDGPLAVNILPLVSDSVCEGASLPGYLLVTGGTPPYQISWNDRTEILDASSLAPVFVPIIQPNFVVTVTDSLGATATDSVQFNHPSFYLDLGVDTILCQWDTMVVVAPPGFDDYNWMSGTTLSNILQLLPVLNDTIQVYLNVMSMQGCVYSDTMNVFFDICSQIEETQLDQPQVRTESGSVTFSFSERNCPDKFIVYTIEGKEIISEVVNGCIININTKEFSPGIYLFKFTDKDLNKITLKIPLY